MALWVKFSKLQFAPEILESYKTTGSFRRAVRKEIFVTKAGWARRTPTVAGVPAEPSGDLTWEVDVLTIPKVPKLYVSGMFHQF